MPLMKKLTVVAAVAESTLGTAASLTATEAAFYAYDIEVDVATDNHPREYQGTASPMPDVIGARMATVRFKVDVHGKGSAGQPDWATVLLAGCGMYNSTGTFKLATAAPAAAGDVGRTLTIGIYQDGRRVLLAGAMGNVKFVLVNGDKAYAEFEFKGKYSAVADVAILAPTLPSVTPPRCSNLTYTWSSYSFPGVKQIEIDLGNEVYLREDISDGAGSAGYAYACVVDRRPIISLTPDAVLVATKDVYGLMLAGTTGAFSAVVGTAANNIMTFAAPAGQIVSASPTAEDKIWKEAIQILCTRSAANDDEFTLAFT